MRDSPPPATPSQAGDGTQPTRVSLRSQDREQAAWTLSREEGALTLKKQDQDEGSGEGEHVFPEDVFHESIELRRVPLVGPVIVACLPKRRFFELENGDDVPTIEAWLGKLSPRQLQRLLCRHFSGWLLAAAVILLVISLPIPLTGLEADPATGALGASLLLLWILARARPAPWLLAGFALWCLAAALSLAWELRGEPPGLWSVLFFFLLLGGTLSGFKIWRRLSQLSR